jgi:acyl-CoA synthetase (AMP-forming)/AMP-acid ligase II
MVRQMVGTDMSIGRADTILKDDIVATYAAPDYWGDMTYPLLLERNARCHADDVAVADERRQITWAALWADARKLAAHFIEMGVARGDVVAIQLPNRIDYVVALAASNLAGAIASPYLVNLRAHEVKFILNFSRAVVVIVAADGAYDLVGMVTGLRTELPFLKQIITVGDYGAAHEGVVTLESLLNAAPEAGFIDQQLRQRVTAPGDVNRIMFTSGSTGDPKGVLHTHGSTLYNNRFFNEFLGLNERSVLLVFVPLTLNLGMFHVFQAALLPCTLVLIETFTPEKVIGSVGDWKVTGFACPPTALLAMTRDPMFSKSKFSSLKFVISAGTPCAADVQRALVEALGCPLLDGYGMTEAGWISATRLDDDPARSEGTVGFPLPWMGLAICDEDGNAVAPGVVGEVTLGGPSICVGYYNAPRRNAESWMPNGRFRTGDLGFIDSAGRLRLVGRSKDLIKHGGMGVHPREIEEVLATHPKIAAVIVVGIPDAYFGENGCACVVPKADAAITLDEIIAYLTDKIAKYKIPQHLEIFDHIPLAASGKIQRHVLRDDVHARLRRAAAGG